MENAFANYGHDDVETKIAPRRLLPHHDALMSLLLGGDLLENSK